MKRARRVNLSLGRTASKQEIETLTVSLKAPKGKLNRYFSQGLQLPTWGRLWQQKGGGKLWKTGWRGRSPLAQVLVAYPVLQVKFTLEPKANASGRTSLPLAGSPG